MEKNFSKPYCSSQVFADSYYTLEVPPSGTLRFEYANSFGIQIFDSCNGESLFCGYKSLHSSNYKLDVENLTPGETILIQVFQTDLEYIPPGQYGYYGYYYEVESAYFNLAVSEIQLPPNSNCSSASAIDIETLSFDPYKHNLNIDPACGYAEADIFYKFVVPETGAVKLSRSVYSSDYYFFYPYIDNDWYFGGISLYNSCIEAPFYCAPFQRFTYNGATSSQITNGIDKVYGSVVISDLNPNDTLILQLLSKVDIATYQTSFEIVEPTINNRCENALTQNISNETECAEMSNFSLQENSLNLLPMCYKENSQALDIKPFSDIYYQTTVPQSGSIQFNLSSPVGIALYDSCNGNNVFCDKEADINLQVSNLTPNTNIIIQFFDYWDMPDNFSFCLNDTPLHCNLDDWKALKALYESTNGSNWVIDDGWEQVESNEPPEGCDLSLLYGVSINEAGRVSCIDLDGLNDCTYDVQSGGNNLTGTLPTEIGLLTELNQLCLNFNSIEGTLPVDIAKLSNLKTLLLHSNRLTNEIPNNIFNHLKNLEILFLSDNQFTGSIPNSLGQSESLIDLGLFQNKLTGQIPVSLSNLSNLINLNLRNNQLSGSIPAQLGNVSTLKGLFLSSNKLSGTLPSNFAALNNLESIILHNNQLSGCFHEDLSVLCNQLTKPDAGNNINTGNGFEARWEDFCACNAGSCQEENETFVISENLQLNGIYNQSGDIKTEGAVHVKNGSFVFFTAKNIYLNSGFEVDKGSTFTAIYDPCTNFFQKLEE